MTPPDPYADIKEFQATMEKFAHDLSVANTAVDRWRDHDDVLPMIYDRLYEQAETLKKMFKPLADKAARAKGKGESFDIAEADWTPVMLQYLRCYRLRVALEREMKAAPGDFAEFSKLTGIQVEITE